MCLKRFFPKTFCLLTPETRFKGVVAQNRALGVELNHSAGKRVQRGLR